MLFFLMRRRLGGINGAEIARGTVKISVAALGMGLSLMAWMQLTGSLPPWMTGLGGVAAGGVVYCLGVVLLKIPEVERVLGVLRRRLG